MDKFLEVVYSNQIADTDKGDMFETFFEHFFAKLKETVSEKIYNEMYDEFISCMIENNQFYAVEGMKMAIGIMEGTYTPIV